MTEPTGYTALDLVGFTDKGTYNPATPYVKNDLVHYSGDTWRCLIDDTTNITPVEGVNWTLFIEAPTNAIEGIIAPVETNPATDSYAVGRQFIYNDSLYKVITAITAEDTLVAYEDDPSNANIRLADPVETQLLDFEEKAYSTDDSAETTLASGDLVPFYDTSAAAKKKMTVANMIGQTVSNLNLLDNPWFTINQRNITAATSNGYTVDRWTLQGANSNNTFENANGTITLNHNDTATTIQLLQYLEDDLYSNLKGKRVTLSVLLGDGTIKKNIGTIPSTSGSGTSVMLNEYGFYCDLFVNASNHLNVRIVSWSGQSVIAGTVSIRAVKLELGSVSTLAMDTAPNYATELLKCQRYFYRLKSTGGNDWIAFGKAWSSSAVNVIIPIPSMRAVPTASVSDMTKLLVAKGSSTLDPHRISQILAGYYKEFGSSIAMTLTLADSTVTNGDSYVLKAEAPVNIDFSADL